MRNENGVTMNLKAAQQLDAQLEKTLNELRPAERGKRPGDCPGRQRSDLDVEAPLRHREVLGKAGGKEGAPSRPALP